MSEPLYKVQRKLSRRRLNAVNKGLIGLIDLGSAKVVCFILQFTPGIEKRYELDEGTFLPKNVAFRIIGVATTRSRGLKLGEIEEEEMDKVFNRGCGLTLVVSPFYAENIQRMLKNLGLKSWVIGKVESGDGSVRWS